MLQEDGSRGVPVTDGCCLWPTIIIIIIMRLILVPWRADQAVEAALLKEILTQTTFRGDLGHNMDGKSMFAGWTVVRLHLCERIRETSGMANPSTPFSMADGVAPCIRAGEDRRKTDGEKLALAGDRRTAHGDGDGRRLYRGDGDIDIRMHLLAHPLGQPRTVGHVR